MVSLVETQKTTEEIFHNVSNILSNVFKADGTLKFSPEERIAISEIDGRHDESGAYSRFCDCLADLLDFTELCDSSGLNPQQAKNAKIITDRILKELELRGFNDMDAFFEGNINESQFSREDQKIKQVKAVDDLVQSLTAKTNFDTIISSIGENPNQFIREIDEYLKNKSNLNTTVTNPLEKGSIKNDIDKALANLGQTIIVNQQRIAQYQVDNPNVPEFSNAITELETLAEKIGSYQTLISQGTSQAMTTLAEEIVNLQGINHAEDTKCLEAVEKFKLKYSDDTSGLTNYDPLLKLRVLEITDTEIALLNRDIVLSDHRIAEVRAQLESIHNALNNDFVKSKLSAEVRNLKNLFGSLLNVADVNQITEAQIRNFLIEQSKIIASEIQEDIHAASNNFQDSYIQDSNGNGREEKAYAAYLLMGHKRAENNDNLSAAPIDYKRHIQLFSSELMSELLSNKIVTLENLNEVKNLTEVTTLANESELIHLFDTMQARVEKEYPQGMEVGMSEEEANQVREGRISLYSYELSQSDLFRTCSMSDLIRANSTHSNNPDLNAYITLLKTQERNITVGNLLAVNDPAVDQARVDKQDLRKHHVLTQYQNNEDRKISNNVNKGMNDLVDQQRQILEERLKKITTPYRRLITKITSLLYKVNAVANFGLWLVYKLTGTVATSVFVAAAVVCAFVATPLVIPMICAAIIMTFPAWVIRPFLQASCDLSKDGFAHEMGLMNLRIDAQRKILTETTDNESELIAKYLIISEELINKFEPGIINYRRRNDIRTFFRKTLSAYGLLEISAENKGSVREDVAFKKEFADINKWIIKGWASIPEARRQSVKVAIKKVGFRDKYGEQAWKAFTKEYGEYPDERTANRINLPIPDGLPQIIKYLLQTEIKSEDAQIEDLAEPQGNWFGDDVLVNIGNLHQLRIKPDTTSRASAIRTFASRINEKLPNKFGDRDGGRLSQLARKESIFNLLMYRMGNLDINSPKGGMGRKR